MTPLELLTIFSLYSNKPLLDSIESSDFCMGPRIDELKADGKSAMQSILRDEFGLEWDGNGKLSDFIVNEQRKSDAVVLARQRITDRIDKLSKARMALMFPVVAGPEQVSAALLELGE